jgi:hypothetical protein
MLWALGIPTKKKKKPLEFSCHGTMPFTKTIVHKNLVKIEKQIMT